MIKQGDKVNYHTTNCGPQTSYGHIVESLLLEPNSFGQDVAIISGVSHPVSLNSLSKCKDEGFDAAFDSIFGKNAA